MKYRRLGHSGLKVSALGLGSWLTLGRSVEADETERMVQSAFDAGVNLFDTADVYERGAAERALGKAIGGLPRHHLVVATKCFFPMSDDVNDRGLARKHVHESLHRSLIRLNTDYVDLYQCHRFDPEVPLEETCRAMDDLIRRGDVLYWGVSAWPGHAIQQAVTLCRANGWHVPISNQPLYNLLERGIEAEVLPLSQASGVGQLVYSPLAQGVLTGKYRPGAAPPAGSRATDEGAVRFVERFMGGDALERVARFVALAAAEGLEPGALALAACLARPGVASALVGARSVAQLQQNLRAVDITVGADLQARLDELFPPAAPTSV